MDPLVARKTAQTLEPVHACVYFVPEAQEEYAAAGLDVKANRAAGYFPARAAAMGRVGPGIVTATFYVFSPLAVQFGMAGAWDAVTPEDLQAARRRGVDRALRRLGGDLAEAPEVDEAAALARRAAEACRPEGRPLFAAHADLAWPGEPLLDLWHALSLLREHRGDGHVAVLVDEGITAVQAGVLHIAYGGIWTKKAWTATRAWSEEDWAAACEQLRARGWLTPDGEDLTEAGQQAREEVERRTDLAAIAPWEALGEDDAARLRALVRPLSKAVVEGGGMGPTKAR